MASAFPLTFSLSEEELTCPICLELVNNPVTIPCGHNFCHKCIESCWDDGGQPGKCVCPQCRSKFTQKPTLSCNTMLSSVVAQFRVSCRGKQTREARPGEAACDVCVGRKLKAAKSCLTCLVSYCEVHLLFHRESHAFAQHKLSDPIPELSERKCDQHSKELELFCREHRSCICCLCLLEHKHCQVFTLEQARHGEVENLKQKIQDEIETIVKKTTDYQQQSVSNSEKALHLKNAVAEQFHKLRKMIEAGEEIANKVIDKAEQAAQKQISDLQQNIQQKMDGVKKSQEEIEQLILPADCWEFVQEIIRLLQASDSGPLPQHNVEMDEKKIQDIFDIVSAFEESISAQLYTPLITALQETTGLLRNKLKTTSANREELLKYARKLTFDLTTTRSNHELSLGNTRLQFASNIEASISGSQVLCSPGFSSSQHYWEVEITSDFSLHCAFGITYKCDDNEEVRNFLGYSSTSWCVMMEEDLCKFGLYMSTIKNVYAYHNNTIHKLAKPCSSTVGVHLDWERGSVTFYSVTDTVTLLYRFTARFTKPVYPAVWTKNGVTVTLINLCSGTI
ncbi:E3 ubiquitin/ISG15 ligase TRIM25-like isoform X2 [Heterodontus francisci]|uniref:E3 ubiquitin/ISG15 ligase TRIM25-like isoform X2 n=1 Tax=Heterodontus francisci TaxID=7792 RepID=UPI00355ADFD3